MGSTTSKAARTTASTSTRKYPKRDPTHIPPPTSEPSISPPPHQATSTPPNPSTSSPTLLSSLRTLGPVTPINPYNPSSPSQSPHTPPSFPDPASSPSILLLTARERIRVAAEAEFSSPSRKSMDGDAGRGGGDGETGRRFLDVGAIQRVLVLRDEKGVGEEEIERVMGLGRGVVGGLGGRGVVEGV